MPQPIFGGFTPLIEHGSSLIIEAMRFRQIIIAAGVATTLYLAIGQTSPKKSEAPRAKNISRNDFLSHLRGKSAENHDGRDLGKLKDVVIDLHRSSIELAIFSTGGFMGLGKSLKAAPAPAVSAGTAKRGILALDIHTRYWKRAPQLSKRELAQVKLPATTKRVYDFYQHTRSADKTAFAWTPNQDSVLSATGREVGSEVRVTQGWN